MATDTSAAGTGCLLDDVIVCMSMFVLSVLFLRVTSEAEANDAYNLLLFVAPDS